MCSTQEMLLTNQLKNKYINETMKLDDIDNIINNKEAMNINNNRKQRG